MVTKDKIKAMAVYKNQCTAYSRPVMSNTQGGALSKQPAAVPSHETSTLER